MSLEDIMNVKEAPLAQTNIDLISVINYGLKLQSECPLIKITDGEC